MTRLDRKIALVTGGGTGIGKATAIAFAAAGANVVVAGRRVELLNETVRLVCEAGGRAIAVVTDVSQSDQVKAMVQAAVDTYGGLDWAFNNAGGFYFLGGGLNKIAEISEESWDRVVGINLKGVFLCMKFEIPEMLKRGGGAIVNNSSTDGIRSAPMMASYCAAKGGVISLTRTAAVEYARDGIRINSILPGWVMTDPVEQRMVEHPDGIDKMFAQEPIGRFGTPEEVAASVVWLCSNDASFVTGTAIPVDGGYLA